MNALKTHAALRLSIPFTFRRGLLYLIVKNVVRDTYRPRYHLLGEFFSSILEFWDESVVIIKSTKDVRSAFTQDEACSHDTPQRILRHSLRMLTLALDGV